MIISKKDTKTAKDLIEQIRALSFKLVDEGAGVASRYSTYKANG